MAICNKVIFRSLFLKKGYEKLQVKLHTEHSLKLLVVNAWTPDGFQYALFLGVVGCDDAHSHGLLLTQQLQQQQDQLDFFVIGKWTDQWRNTINELFRH